MARRPGKTVMFVTHNVREAIRLGDRVVLLSSRPGRVARDHARRRSSGRGASTRPRSQRSQRRSPTASAMRWSVMPAGSDTLHPVEDPDIAAFEEQFGRGPSRVAQGLVGALAEAARVRVLHRRVAGRRVDRLEAGVRRSPRRSRSSTSSGRTRARSGKRPRRRCGARGQGLRDRARHRHRRRAARVALEDPALRRRLDDHRPADDAVDRVVPRSRSSLFGLNESAILFVVVLGAAPSIANGFISGVDNIPPVLLRAGRVLGARGLVVGAPRRPAGRAAVVRRRAEAGLGVRLAQPARR